MKFINIYNNDECVAEVCGEVELTVSNCIITTEPKDKYKALAIVNEVSNSCYSRGKLVVNHDSVRYMSNVESAQKPSIRLINDSGN